MYINTVNCAAREGGGSSKSGWGERRIKIIPINGLIYASAVKHAPG